MNHSTSIYRRLGATSAVATILLACGVWTLFRTNGITGGDLLLIVNHIFGDVLPSPYQWVAADANGDGKISLVDYSRINSVALGTNQHLPGGTPDWKFIPKS